MDERYAPWPEDLKAAVADLEAQFGCEMVSIEHHEKRLLEVERGTLERAALHAEHKLLCYPKASPAAIRNSIRALAGNV